MNKKTLFLIIINFVSISFAQQPPSTTFPHVNTPEWNNKRLAIDSVSKYVNSAHLNPITQNMQNWYEIYTFHYLDHSIETIMRPLTAQEPTVIVNHNGNPGIYTMATQYIQPEEWDGLNQLFIAINGYTPIDGLTNSAKSNSNE